jgi:hypothetical protein
MGEGFAFFYWHRLVWPDWTGCVSADGDKMGPALADHTACLADFRRVHHVIAP